jgi:hypothetical protein
MHDLNLLMWLSGWLTGMERCSCINSTPLAKTNGKVKHALNAFQGSNIPDTTGEVEKATEKLMKKSRNQKKRDRAKR